MRMRFQNSICCKINSGRNFTASSRFATSIAAKELIMLSIQVEHTYLLINGQFVVAASGSLT